MSATLATNKLLGFDNHCTVLEAEDRVLRRIDRAYSAAALGYFRIYEKARLSRMGIVKTALFEQTEELTLAHEKHRITYPFEWPAEMYKDAVLFHLNLFLALNAHGLTLKDALPSNILFNFTRPVFVDFLSLVRINALKEESWLVPSGCKGDARRYVFKKMFLPYMLRPLLAARRQDYQLMRDLLSRRSCNCGTAQLNLRDLCTGKPFYIPLKVLDFLIYFILEKKAQTHSILKYAELLKRLVQRSEVTPAQSAYASYYGAKKENFSLDSEAGWLTKQKTIKKIILSRQPASVLDIGSNTGWYSLLAEKYGSTVIATDSDEASVNLLYQRAKADRLNILPLLLPFNNFSREIFPDPALAGVSGPPLFLKATHRLRSDLVLCLGLIHHLILGQGYSPEAVISALSELARSTLVIEFVGLNDPLIENEKDFFPKLKRMAPTYRRDTLVTLGRKMFGECEILPSSPDTRQIMVFRRQVPGVGAIDGLGMVQTSSNGSAA